MNRTAKRAALAAALLCAGAAGAVQQLVSSRYCFFEGWKLSGFDGTLTLAPVAPQGFVNIYDGADMPVYTALPQAGWAIDKWAIIPFANVNAAATYDQTSPVAVYTANSSETSAGGYVLAPKWKIAFATAGAFLDLCPCYKWLTYSIRYIPWEGEGEKTALRQTGLIYTNSATLASAADTSSWKRDHYELVGFSTKPSATKAEFALGEAIAVAGQKLGATTNGIVYIYGVWKKQSEKYTVTLDRGTGAVAGDTSVTAEYGEAMPPAVMPSRPNYDFAGYWLGSVQYYSASGASMHKWETDGAGTLVAKWTASGATASLSNGDGATGGQTSAAAQTGQDLPSVKIPSRPGWTFDGYWTHSAGGTQYYSKSGAGVATWNLPSGTTLHAHWKPIEYNIAYDWAGGTAPSHAPEKASFAVPFAVGVPSRTGYVFAGFALSGSDADMATARHGASPAAVDSKFSSGSTGAYADGTPFIYFAGLSTSAGGTVKLTAKWAAAKSLKTASASRASAGDATATTAQLAAAADTSLSLTAHYAQSGSWKEGNSTAPTWEVDSTDSSKGGSSVKLTMPFSPKAIRGLSATATGPGTLSFKWKISDAGEASQVAFATNMPSSSLTGGTGYSVHKFTDAAKKCFVADKPSTSWTEVKIETKDAKSVSFDWLAEASSSVPNYDLHIDEITWTAGSGDSGTTPDPGSDNPEPEPEPGSDAKPVVAAYAIDCIGEYDGKPHTIEVLKDPAVSGATVKYSLSKAGPFSSSAPTFVNATDSEVWYEVSASGCASWTNSAKVAIAKASNGWVVAPKITGRVEGKTYAAPAAQAFYGVHSVTYSPGGSTCPTSAGKVTATFTVPEGANWKGLSTSVAFTIAAEEADDGSDGGGGDDDGGTVAPETPDWSNYPVAFTNSPAYAKAQTCLAALYAADGTLAGTVQIKFGKLNAKKNTVAVSATAKLLTGKSCSAKSATLTLDNYGGLSGTLVFKAPVGEMSIVADGTGAGILAGAGYVAQLARIGGDLAKSATSGTFSLAGDFSLPGATGEVQDYLLPAGVAFTVAKGKWKFAGNSTVKVVRDKTTKEYSLSVTYGTKGDKTNESALKLSYSAKTGYFSGSFKVYTLYTTTAGVLKLKTYTVKVTGFVIDGKGEGAATCSGVKPAAGPWKVTVE